MKQEDPALRTKSFEIPKRLVGEAWKRVWANQGAPGVDRKTLQAYKTDLGRNLYTLWNRMSSGSYFPSPVRQVLIPKWDGHSRPLGIPTVQDRVAQMVVKQVLEPRLEALFHPSSFGYRPGKSAHQAVAQAKQNCWRYDWVLDVDLKAFFDTIDHDLLLRAVDRQVPEPWIRLYIRRWLACPVELPDGEKQERHRGTPQGGVISPLLANLYLHYAFDDWMRRNHPNVPFERYADDLVCHCRSREEAEALREHLEVRMRECKLELHPQKTQIVYCQDARRREVYSQTRFDFLGFGFHARTVQDRRGKLFSGFNPGVSRKALKRMNATIQDLGLTRRTPATLEDLARLLNAKVRGWIAYYGAFYPEPLKRFLIRIDLNLGRWARNKYKRLRGHKRRAWQWLKRIREGSPKMFVHWDYLFSKGQG